MIDLDGAAGEGGGQILRTALALSMITGQRFRIAGIRANRTKPGLMRQHLVAMQAAAQVSGAGVTGSELGSSALSFTPGRIKGGDYHFSPSARPAAVRWCCKPPYWPCCMRSSPQPSASPEACIR